MMEEATKACHGDLYEFVLFCDALCCFILFYVCFVSAGCVVLFRLGVFCPGSSVQASNYDVIGNRITRRQNYRTSKS